MWQFIYLALVFFIAPTYGAVVQLDGNTFESTIANAEVAFINFYADWCRFSQMLTPVFEEASNKFPDSTKVVWGSVDCDRHAEVSQKFHINKYPTLKLFRNGELSKREYRGQRSMEALSAFIQQQLEDTTKELTSIEDLETKINKDRRNVIAYYSWKQGVEWDNFRKIASNLREECDFWVGTGDNFKQQTLNGNTLIFKPPRSVNDDVPFSGNMQDFEYFKQWITDKCIPLVREITFENAEELTEEGLPFLILFRHPDDHTIVETFTQEVARQLIDQKTAVNFLVADGVRFAHPLHHLGKTEKDLPVLAIDSFRHMYLFDDVKHLTTPGKLRQFVLDLHSGKLHREFHHGPDPTPEQPAEQQPDSPGQPAPAGQPDSPSPGSDSAHLNPLYDQRTSPPESIFQKLKPSRNRYTLAKDEL